MAKYQIFGGKDRKDNGETVRGFLEPKSGNTVIKGAALPCAVRLGTLGIPNATHAWGIRLDKSGKVPEKVLQVDDEDYRGEVKFVKWGTQVKEGATKITCRWIDGYDTIDRNYQELKLGIKVDQDGLLEGQPISFITFQHGLNEFDDVSNKALVQMLKVHHNNEKSIYCDPKLDSGYMFTEVDQEGINKAKTQFIDDKVACIMLVTEAGKSPEAIKNLFDIVKGVETETVNKEDIGEIYTSLKYFADGQPDIFAKRVYEYKVKVSDAFEKAKSYEILDLTKDGFVAVEDGKKKKEIVISDLPAKGEEMLTYMFDHFLDKEVYAGVEKLQRITDKIK
jgi:hypothetical protein